MNNNNNILKNNSNKNINSNPFFRKSYASLLNKGVTHEKTISKKKDSNLEKISWTEFLKTENVPLKKKTVKKSELRKQDKVVKRMVSCMHFHLVQFVKFYSEHDKDFNSKKFLKKAEKAFEKDLKRFEGEEDLVKGFDKKTRSLLERVIKAEEHGSKADIIKSAIAIGPNTGPNVTGYFFSGVEYQKVTDQEIAHRYMYNLVSLTCRFGFTKFFDLLLENYVSKFKDIKLVEAEEVTEKTHLKKKEKEQTHNINTLFREIQASLKERAVLQDPSRRVAKNKRNAIRYIYDLKRYSEGTKAEAKRIGKIIKSLTKKN